MVRPDLCGCRHYCWLLLFPVIGLALFLTAVTAAPPAQVDAAAQCAEGVKRFRAGDAKAARPLLEAGFAARAGAPFAQPDDLAVCALTLGLLRDQMSDYMGAFEAYEVALGVLREGGNKDFEGIVLYNLGAVYEAQGRYGEALTYYQQALTIWREVGDRTGEGATLRNLGAMYWAQGRYGEALTHYQQALPIAREIGDRAGEGATLHNLGAMYQAQKKYVEAQPYFEAAAAFIDSLRQGAGSSVARIGFIERFASVYHFLVLNAIRLSLFEKAFVISERGRSRAFLDELSSGTVTLSDTVAGRLLQQEQALFAQRRALDDELTRLRAKPDVNRQRLADLEAQRVTIQQDYDTTLSRLHTVNEELAALASGEPLGIREVQPLLPPHTTLLAYFVLDDVTIAAFMLTRTQFEVVELPVNRAALVDNIQSFRLFGAHPLLL
jgi:tetratricopeptide (TPR) repeat protein